MKKKEHNDRKSISQPPVDENGPPAAHSEL